MTMSVSIKTKDLSENLAVYISLLVIDIAPENFSEFVDGVCGERTYILFDLTLKEFCRLIKELIGFHYRLKYDWKNWKTRTFVLKKI